MVAKTNKCQECQLYFLTILLAQPLCSMPTGLVQALASPHGISIASKASFALFMDPRLPHLFPFQSILYLPGVVLKFQLASESLEGLVKTQNSGLHPQTVLIWLVCEEAPEFPL